MTIQIRNINLLVPQKLDNLKNIFQMTLEEAVIFFVKTLKPITGETYGYAFKRIFDLLSSAGILTKDITLQEYQEFNPSNILDYIRENFPGSQSTKQSRSACYISFTKYLERVSNGKFKVAVPKKGINATFKVVRRKAATKTITHEQWILFSNALKSKYPREWMIARAIYQGAKRINEVLLAKIENINWKERTIKYMQNKSHNLDGHTIINYPESFMSDLKTYLGSRKKGYIFIAKNGNRLFPENVRTVFTDICCIENLPHLHPHMLRTSAITNFFNMGYHSEDIMKVSGHQHSSSVLYYDKSPVENNLTKNVDLIC